MKAVVYERYGPPEVLKFKEVEKPSPGKNEVLIKIHATTVSSADWRVRSLSMPTGFAVIAPLIFGLSKPRQPILGSELAGEIESIGADVTQFAAGDRVFAFSGMRMGCHAQYTCFPENGALTLIPPNLTYEVAAALSFGGTTALDFFRRGKLQRGESVLINGASGSVGTAMVQFARHFGAQVTAVCSGPNAGLVRSLGAAHVIDYTREDFARNGQRYDVIVDTAGTAPYGRCKHSLKDGGRLLLVLAGLPAMLQIPWVALTSNKKIFAGPAAERAEDLQQLAQLANLGEFKPVIDRCYPFEEIIEAHRYVDSGRKKGNVIITLV
ncbi:MAG: NAD(P)-dependent alcohol dehydrogenase [Burkholderiales bacterium]